MLPRPYLSIVDTYLLDVVWVGETPSFPDIRLSDLVTCVTTSTRPRGSTVTASTVVWILVCDRSLYFALQFYVDISRVEQDGILLAIAGLLRDGTEGERQRTTVFYHTHNATTLIQAAFGYFVL
jgi:hypothetical protein